MAQSALTAKTGQNFAVADLGQFSQLHQFTFEAPEAAIINPAIEEPTG